MVRWLQSLAPALRIALYAFTVAAVLALAVGIGAMATLIYQGGIGSGGGAEPEQGSNQEDTQISAASEPTQMSAAEYSTTVGTVQNESVETFLDSHTRLRRYDTLNATDIDALEANYLALGDYDNQVENLDPPEGYEGQYALFSGAIGELYAAAEIAYRVAEDPRTATQVDFRAYDGHLDEATASLQRSNQILGQSYRTTEGLPKMSLI
jgi:hypothetical protein